MHIFNAHIHLNGSISLAYLKATAKRNNCRAFYDSFIAETNLWKKFDWIHKIIQTPADVQLATLDVVKHSKADFIEIRTTAKAMNEGSSVDDYIQAFIAGLQDAKREYPKKQAHGLLSIDRARHSLADAKSIIDAALIEKQKTGMIVGVDLSGNFMGKRTLSGNDLAEAVMYALLKDIGIALHVGEIDTEDERRDFDIILKTIEDYKLDHQGRIYGKVRLGHAIYRTAEQDEKIKALKIPVEICPSCHQQLDWWKEGQPHPILTLYQHRTRVLPGTDDNILFNCDDEQEQKKLDEILPVPEKYAHLSEPEQQQKVAEKRKRYMFS